jgi:hypothetical protein
MSGSQNKQQAEKSQGKVKRGKTEQPVKKRIKLAQMLEAPDTMRQGDVLNAQQQVGNQVVQRALGKKGRPEPVTDEQGNLKTEISDAIQGQRGGGSPVPENIRVDVSKRFKRDFEDVRLHTDDRADQLSRKIRARAFTIGKDIFFKKGVFSPGTSQGRETLIHELTHVIQQSGSKGSGGRLKLGARDSAHEQEADRVGKQNSTPSLSGGTAPGSAVQTFGEEDELQMQAVEEEEEELQMQEEEELQMQEEGEEVQMQEEEELQMQEEEELQMQEEDEEEEEIQMQPDTQGVVQRSFTDWFKKKKKSGSGSGQEIEMEDINIQDALSPIPEAPKMPKNLLAKKTTPANLPSGKYQDLETARKKMKIGSKSNIKKLKEFDTNKEVSKLRQSEKKQQTDKRLQLMKTLRDPNTSTEDAEKSEKELKELHQSTDVKDMFKLSHARRGKIDRLKALKEKAKKGDQEAYKQLTEEESKTPGFEKFMAKSSGEKAVGIGKGLASGLWKGAKGLFGSTAKDLKTHFFGAEKKKEEKKEEKPAAPPVTVNVGGGGGGGGGGMMEIMEKYADLRQENKDLKKQLKDLQ